MSSMALIHIWVGFSNTDLQSMYFMMKPAGGSGAVRLVELQANYQFDIGKQHAVLSKLTL